MRGKGGREGGGEGEGGGGWGGEGGLFLLFFFDLFESSVDW